MVLDRLDDIEMRLRRLEGVPEIAGFFREQAAEMKAVHDKAVASEKAEAEAAKEAAIEKSRAAAAAAAERLKAGEHNGL